ncbi:diguanylate cyclase (GGDEF)-like protein [Methylovirgula ligni]|uniref:diguanylate cyclase n=2 Tax=Methylovirgula ligni TaxID=569860 RepID=A0A3D9YVW4_9HYPH|nr:diguanylate cyclase (GGDEF)-like protein [Methylovirgula ligni]
MGLGITFFSNWLVTRSEKFLINWGITVTLLTIGALIYGFYTEFPSPLIGAVAYTILVFGLSLVWGVSREFRCGTLPHRAVFTIASYASVAVGLPMLIGFDGISYIFLNFVALAILLSTARDYWLSRAEAPLSIGVLSSFYILIAASFIPCAVMLLQSRDWHLGHAPSNWAEDLNIGVSLAGLVGIGAISLMLNQVRVARGHKIDAETDVLTGLFNRRALFVRATAILNSSAAFIIFDIDCFKEINDLHGHLKGDEVLRAFGQILKECSRAEDLAVRLGGEEFALALPRSTMATAINVAERICTYFSQRQFDSASGEFCSTVSGGISCVEGKSDNLEVLLHRADEALYMAKRTGKNRVAVRGHPEECELSSKEQHTRNRADALNQAVN